MTLLKSVLLKFALFCVFIITIFETSAQQMPIDFNDPLENFTGFSGSSFSTRADPDDSGNTVGEFFNDGSNVNQGFLIDLERPIDLDFQSTISLSFYAFDPNAHDITLKLENGSNPDTEITINRNGMAGWTHDLVFDFGSAMGTYNRLTIFIDLGSGTAGTYLIDNIDDGSEDSGSGIELDVVYDVLVWADEFDTNGAIDTSKWFHQTILPNGVSWYNGELQHYTDKLDNSFVENGFLNIVAKKENFTDQGVTKGFTSARLNSKYSFTYGRVDVRAKLPSGAGTWPAIWTLGKNIDENGAYWEQQGFGTTPWPECGEIDIMEHGLYGINEVSCAIHTPSSFGNTVNTTTKVLNDVANEFHIYSMNWSPNKIVFLIDNEPFYQYKPSTQDASTWPFDLEQYLILNIAMGGIAGTIDPSFTESSMVIDYVRIYQDGPLSLSEVEKSKSILTYPNPVADKLYINLPDFASGKVLVNVYNSLGKLLLSQKEEASKQLVISEFKGLKAGIYIVSVIYDNHEEVVKVMKR